MTRILLIPNPNLSDLDKAINDVACYFDDYELFIDALDSKEAFKLLDAKLSSFEMVVTLGGDGSMLKVAELVYKHDLCMFGINYGGIGYLTSLKKDELSILNNEKYITYHSMLDVEIPSKKYKHVALNDVVIFKANVNVPIKLNVFDGQDTNKYFADGLIIATATGSSAYSYSAGGPIIEEGHIILTPVCPVLRSTKYHIYDDKVIFKINSFRDNRDKAYISYDGFNQVKIDKNDIVKVKKAPKYLKIVRFKR